MSELHGTHEKWGNFDITDEQAERINNGDVEEFDLFFFRNYKYIKKRCKRIFFKRGINDDYQQGVNSVYLDLRFAKLKSGHQIEKLINVACSYSHLGGWTLCRRDAPQYDSYYKLLHVESGFDIPADRYDADDRTEYFLLDHSENFYPSPQEEMDIELEQARANDVDKLCEILSPFLTPLQNKVLPFFLNGMSVSVIAEYLNISKNSVNKNREKIRNRFILNYDKVLAALIDGGYPLEYLKGIFPVNYNMVIQKVNDEKRMINEATKRWRERNKEHISEYQRNYYLEHSAQFNTS